MARIVSIGLPVVLLVLMLTSAPTLDHFLNSPDMGYQLSLGRLTLLGKFPFVDMLQHYGPLVAFTSAAGQRVHDSVIPEIVICSLGYCLAMTCIFLVVRRDAAARPGWAIIVGLAASLCAWCMLARFYKWYYWCFPMLMLYCISHFYEDQAKWRFWRFTAGLIAATGFLYRHDLGLACLLTAFLIIAAQTRLTRRGRGITVELAWLASGFLLPLVCWFSILAAVGGPMGCWQYLSALWDSTSGTAQHWRTPLPRWNWRTPASFDSCRFLLLALMGLFYTMAIFIGAWLLLRKGKELPPDAVLLPAAGIIGLAIFPQALFRPDTQHILQIIPPLLVVAALLVLRLLDKRPAERPRPGIRAARASAALTFLAIMAFPLICLRNDFRIDLAPLGVNLLQRYRALGAGLDAADPTNPVAEVARAVQLRASPDQTILVTPLMPQIYYWADRPMSGLLNGYAGIFSKDTWRKCNLEAVERQPPALVVADRDFLNGNPHALFQKFNPELYSWLKERYTLVIAESGNLVVCAEKGVRNHY